MRLNIFNILYFTFRMIPFVLICYFIINTMFLQDMKSLIFLAGLCLACFVAGFVGTMFPTFNQKGLPSTRSVCNTVPLFDTGPSSRLPLTTVIYTYMLCYLAIPIMHYGRQDNNVQVLSVVPILTFLDMCWLYFFGCASTWNIFGAGAVGMVVGFAWGEGIYRSDLRKIQYFSILNHQDICSEPVKYSYKCKQKVAPAASPSDSTTNKAMTVQDYITLATGVAANVTDNILGGKNSALTDLDTFKQTNDIHVTDFISEKATNATNTIDSIKRQLDYSYSTIAYSLGSMYGQDITLQQAKDEYLIIKKTASEIDNQVKILVSEVNIVKSEIDKKKTVVTVNPPDVKPVNDFSPSSYKIREFDGRGQTYFTENGETNDIGM